MVASVRPGTRIGPTPTRPGFRSTLSNVRQRILQAFRISEPLPRFDSVISCRTRRSYFGWMADCARMFGSGLRREHTLADEAQADAPAEHHEHLADPVRMRHFDLIVSRHL
jgi:hypothetical protein